VGLPIDNNNTNNHYVVLEVQALVT
jgi:hypothetical protein